MTLPIARLYDFVANNTVFANTWNDERENIISQINNRFEGPWQRSVFWEGTISVGKKTEVIIIPASRKFRLKKIKAVFQSGAAGGTTEVRVYKNKTPAEITASTGSHVAAVQLVAGDTAGVAYIGSVLGTVELVEDDYLAFYILSDGQHNNLTVQVSGTQGMNTITATVPIVPSHIFVDAEPIRSGDHNTMFSEIRTVGQDIIFPFMWPVYYENAPSTSDERMQYTSDADLQDFCEATEVKVIFRAGTSTGGTTAFEIRSDLIAAPVLATITLDTSKLINVVYTFPITPIDILTTLVSCVCTNQSGNQADITISIQGRNKSMGGTLFTAPITKASGNTISSNDFESNFEDDVFALNDFSVDLGLYMFSNNPQTTDKFPAYILPDGRGFISSHVNSLWSTGSQSGNKTIEIKRNGVLFATVALTGAGPTVDTIDYVNYAPITNWLENDVITFNCTAAGGSQRDISVQVHVNAKCR